jgi:hypothetical protein
MTTSVPHLYVETDIPEGLTIREWRRLRAGRTARRHRRHRMAQLVLRLAYA